MNWGGRGTGWQRAAMRHQSSKQTTAHSPPTNPNQHHTNITRAHLLLELSAARRLGAGEVEAADVWVRSRAYSATAASSCVRSVADTSIRGGSAVTTRIMSSAAAGAVRGQAKGTSARRWEAGVSCKARAEHIAELSRGRERCDV